MSRTSILLLCWAVCSGRRVKQLGPYGEKSLAENHDHRGFEPTHGIHQSSSAAAGLLQAAQGAAAWQAACIGRAQRPTGCGRSLNCRTFAPVLGFGERGLKPGQSGKARDQQLSYKVGKGKYRKGGPLNRKLVRVKEPWEKPDQYPDSEELDEQHAGERGARKGDSRPYATRKKHPALQRMEKKHGREPEPEWRPRSWALDNAEEIEKAYLPGGRYQDSHEDEFHVSLIEQETGRIMLCSFLEELDHTDGNSYASLSPVDSPVAILQRVGEEDVEIDDENLLDEIFPSAEYCLKALDLTLKRTPVELTVEGLDEVDGTDKDGYDAEYEDDEAALEMDELYTFHHRGKKYVVSRLLEPVFLMGRRVGNGQYVIPTDEEMEAVGPKVMDIMLDAAQDPEWEPGWIQDQQRKERQTKRKLKIKLTEEERLKDSFDDHQKFFGLFDDEDDEFDDDIYEDVPDKRA